MNKSDLARKVSAQTGLTLPKAAEAIDATLEAIKTAVAQKDAVVLKDFGTFDFTVRKGRTGVSPNGSDWVSEEKTVPVFRVGRDFKERVA